MKRLLLLFVLLLMVGGCSYTFHSHRTVNKAKAEEKKRAERRMLIEPADSAKIKAPKSQ